MYSCVCSAKRLIIWIQIIHLFLWNKILFPSENYAHIRHAMWWGLRQIRFLTFSSWPKIVFNAMHSKNRVTDADTICRIVLCNTYHVQALTAAMRSITKPYLLIRTQHTQYAVIQTAAHRNGMLICKSFFNSSVWNNNTLRSVPLSPKYSNHMESTACSNMSKCELDVSSLACINQM